MILERYITTKPLDLAVLIEETADPRAGALVIFGGTVRNENNNLQVKGMTYEAHVSMAAKVIKQIELETIERFDLITCRIQHRIGKQSVKETSVYVVVRAAHRVSAFKAGRFAIDTIKEKVPIWKHEHYVDQTSVYLDSGENKK